MHLKIPRLLERTVIALVCLWGNWALYYWIMVLVFGTSYSTLKAGLPFLTLQIFVSLFLLTRTDLRLDSETPKIISPTTPPRFRPRWPLGILYPTIFAALFSVLAVSAAKLGWSESPLSYNLLWSILVPFAIAYALRKTDSHLSANSGFCDSPPRYQLIDQSLLICCAIVAAYAAYGTGFPTPDDAFYAHVISSTLANPELPVQGQDLLLGTSAPYSLHPGYRSSGLEVLIALLGDIAGVDPLRVCFGIFPVFGTLFWLLTAYLFMRTLRIPYPGLAVVACLVVLLFWVGGKAPGQWFVRLYWGKGLVATLAAPLLFVFTAAFLTARGAASWVLLFLAVCAVSAWSSTALFIVPVSVALATAVFLPLQRPLLKPIALLAAALVPVVLIIVDILTVLHGAPAHVDGGTGVILVSGQAFGGIWTKSLLLITLLVLPTLSRSLPCSLLQVRVLRLCIVGALTVYAPFAIEVFATLSGMHLLSWRLQWAFPSAMLAGIVCGVAIKQIDFSSKTFYERCTRALVALSAILWITLFFKSLEPRFVFGPVPKRHQLFYEAHFAEARAARALIPDGSYVAAGYLDNVLPILPNPPQFVQVRHYLNYHKHFISAQEFELRMQLFKQLESQGQQPNIRNSDSVEWVVTTGERLGVTCFVYMAIPHPLKPETHNARVLFISSLTEALSDAGFKCSTTPSGNTFVCKKVM